MGQEKKKNLFGTFLGKWGRKRGTGYLAPYEFPSLHMPFFIITCL